MPRVRLVLVVLGCLLVFVGGCGLARSIAIGFVYDEVALPEENVRRGLAYLDTGDPKHRLNLFLPLGDSVRTRPWPVVVFVHGGGWTEGDRDLTFGGEDIYNNIGRFFASRGIGAATVSYRLMPTADGVPTPGGVTWREQVEDVAAAVAFVHREIGAYGGDPDGLFMMGHSAGAYLAAAVALDPAPLRRQGLSTDVLCGAIPVSGAGLDLRDRETYRLEDNFDYYSARFAPDRVPLDAPPAEPFGWQREASPIRHARADAPPFLILYAGGETEALQRQSQLLDVALREAGVASEVVVVPGKSHERIVPTLSRDDQTAGPAMLRFVRAQGCG
ncbi:MAG: alpha/beta hydrolase [Rubricoccaceae bacterium]|nr:alpha/beta hydrolase [Rubricoccaceae bacterium]